MDGAAPVDSGRVHEPQAELVERWRVDLFGSARSGSWQVWKMPADGGQPVQVTTNGGHEAFESRDGKYVYYSKGEGAGIWRVPAKGGEETQVMDHATMGHWAVLDRGICFVNLTGKRPVIEFFDFATRRGRTVAVLPNDAEPAGGWGFPAIAVSPDGRSTLYVQAERAESTSSWWRTSAEPTACLNVSVSGGDPRRYPFQKEQSHGTHQEVLAGSGPRRMFVLAVSAASFLERQANNPQVQGDPSSNTSGLSHQQTE